MREPDEWQEGHVPGALHVPRGQPRVAHRGAASPTERREIVVYCASGTRSAFAAKTLGELGYENVVNVAGGFSDWKRNGFDFATPRSLTPAQRSRYSRHLLIPEVGEEGQQKLLDSRVLLIGAGGLGSPASLYLAAAGVGTLGIVDADVVDDSNLQRQIVHSTDRLGEPKVALGEARRSRRSTPTSRRPLPGAARLRERRAILAHGWDVIVDGTDNFPTRYLVNDASVWHGIPVVHGSIYRFEGQVTVFHPGEGPCYRCLYPAPPPPELAPSCAEGGVLGVLPGIVGSLQASEALKLAARGRRHARRPPAALRRAPHDLRRGRDPQEPGLPRVRRGPDDHRVHRLRRVLLARPARAEAPDRMTAVRIPPTLRAEVGGARQVEATGATVREVLDDLADAVSRARRADLDGRRDRAVRQRLPRRRGRAHARRARHGGRRRPTVILLPAMAGGSAATCLALRVAADRARPDRQHAARRAAAAVAQARA